VLDSSAAAGYTGIMTRSAEQVLSTAGKSMGEGALPILASYEAADHFGDLMDLISKGGYTENVSKGIKVADTITVGVGAGAGTYVAQSQALRAGGRAYQAIKALRAARAARVVQETSEGVELGEASAAADATADVTADATADATGELAGAGDGIELGELGETVGTAAADTSVVGGIEDFALATSLAPAPGARPVAALVALSGLVVLAGITIFQMFQPHDTPEQREAKRQQLQKIEEEKFYEISKKYISAQEKKKLDLDNYTRLAPENVLTANEIKFMKGHQPKYFDAVEKNIKTIWDAAHAAHIVYQKHIKIAAQQYQVSTASIQHDLNFLHSGKMSKYDFDKKYEKIEASNLDLDSQHYEGMLQMIEDGYSRKEAYARAATDMATSAGFTSVADYQESLQPGASLGIIEQKEEEDAKQYTAARKQSRKEGFYTADEYQYKNNMVDWTPEISQILRAHGLGFTLREFNQFMEAKSLGKAYTSSFTDLQRKHQIERDQRHLIHDLKTTHYDDYLKSQYSIDFYSRVNAGLNKMKDDTSHLDYIRNHATQATVDRTQSETDEVLEKKKEGETNVQIVEDLIGRSIPGATTDQMTVDSEYDREHAL
jgi:hypothetical protein